MNARINFKNKRNYKGETIADILVESKSNLKSINCPQSLNSSAIDEFLVIFLVAAKAKGISHFRNLSELNKRKSKAKHSYKFFAKNWCNSKEKKDSIKIYGNPELNLNGKYLINNF